MDGLLVTPEVVKAHLDRGESVVFLDVRSPDAWARSGDQAPGAIRLPLTDFEAHADDLPKAAELVAYCT